MNPAMWLIVIVGGAIGILSTLYLIVALVATSIFKFYRKAKYGISLYN